MGAARYALDRPCARAPGTRVTPSLSRPCRARGSPCCSRAREDGNACVHCSRLLSTPSSTALGPGAPPRTVCSPISRSTELGPAWNDPQARAPRVLGLRSAAAADRPCPTREGDTSALRQRREFPPVVDGEMSGARPGGAFSGRGALSRRGELRETARRGRPPGRRISANRTAASERGAVPSRAPRGPARTRGPRRRSRRGCVPPSRHDPARDGRRRCVQHPSAGLRRPGGRAGIAQHAERVHGAPSRIARRASTGVASAGRAAGRKHGGDRPVAPAPRRGGFPPPWARAAITRANDAAARARAPRRRRARRKLFARSISDAGTWSRRRSGSDHRRGRRARAPRRARKRARP